MDPTHELTALRLAAAASPSARDGVTGIFFEEHRTLRIVLQILQRALHESAAFGMAPDFKLLSVVLYYLDDFPERVHHPKEDNHLFPMVRRRTRRFDATIRHLHTDHARSAQMIARIQRELVHFQAGAPQALERITASVAHYAELLEAHMQTEERLLNGARDELTEDDWRHLAQGLGAHHDPLTGDTTRQEFRLLRARIFNALPSKMRLDPASAATMRGLGAD
jgi:hemerythrin-like domain-containing protein